MKTTPLHITIFALITTLAANAADAPPPAKKSDELAARPETTVILDFGKDGKKTMIFPPNPYVNNKGWASILPGESYVIAFEVIDGQPKNPRYVKRESEKDETKKGTIYLSLTQDKDKTILIRRNSLDKSISMTCYTQTYGEQKLRETRLNRIEAGMSSYDGWPNTICSILLADFHFTESQTPPIDAPKTPKK